MKKSNIISTTIIVVVCLVLGFIYVASTIKPISVSDLPLKDRQNIQKVFPLVKKHQFLYAKESYRVLGNSTHNKDSLKVYKGLEEQMMYAHKAYVYSQNYKTLGSSITSINRALKVRNGHDNKVYSVLLDEKIEIQELQKDTQYVSDKLNLASMYNKKHRYYYSYLALKNCHQLLASRKNEYATFYFYPRYKSLVQNLRDNSKYGNDLPLKYK